MAREGRPPDAQGWDDGGAVFASCDLPTFTAAPNVRVG